MKSINRLIQPHFKLLALALALCATTNAAWASAGRFQFTHGDIRIVGIDGRERPAQKGVEINEGESIISAKSASAQLLMADGGVVAIRPETHMRIDEYKFNGQEDGSERSFFSLLKGGFRSITGLIGKLHKKNYGIKTPSATIGIRGTDSETVHVLAGTELPPDVQPGTYNKVNTGATVVNGTVVGPNQVAYSASLNMPATILPNMPSIFEPLKATQAPTRENQKQDRKAENSKDDATKNGKSEGSQPAPGKKTADNQAKPAAANTPDNSAPPQSTDKPPPPPANGAAPPPPPPGGIIKGANIALPPPPPPTTALVGSTGPTGGLTSGSNTILAPIGTGGVGGDISSRPVCNQAGACVNGPLAGSGVIVVEGPNQTILFDAATKQPILVAERDPNGGMKYTSGTAHFVEAGKVAVGSATVVWGRYVGGDQFVDNSGLRDPLTMSLMSTDQAMNQLQANTYFTNNSHTFNIVPGAGNVVDDLGATYSTTGTLTVKATTTPMVSLAINASNASRTWGLDYNGTLQQFYQNNCSTGPCGLPLTSASLAGASFIKGQAGGVFIAPNAVGALTSYSANAFDASGALIGSLQGTSLFKR
jgi:hypothetical protein